MSTENEFHMFLGRHSNYGSCLESWYVEYSMLRKFGMRFDLKSWAALQSIYTYSGIFYTRPP